MFELAALNFQIVDSSHTKGRVQYLKDGDVRIQIPIQENQIILLNK